MEFLIILSRGLYHGFRIGNSMFILKVSDHSGHGSLVESQRLLDNSRIRQLADCQLADWSTRGLDNSRTSQVADWTTRSLADAAKKEN